MKLLSKYLVAALLVVSMLFSAACGSSGDTDKKDRKSRAERDLDDEEEDEKSSRKRKRDKDSEDEDDSEDSGISKLQGFLGGKGASGMDDASDGSDLPDELKDNMDGSHKDAGFFKINTLSEGTNTMDRLQILEHGIEMFLSLEDDGSGYMYMNDHLFDIGWHDGSVMLNDPDDGPTELEYTRGNEYLVFPHDGIVMVFMESDEKAPSRDELAGGAAPAASQDEDEGLLPLIGRYEGDWWGDFYCDDQTGWFKDNLKKDTAYPVIARFAFEEDGSITPFMTTAIFKEPEKYNFNHLDARLDKDEGVILLNGGLMSGTMTEDTKIRVEDDGYMSIETVLTNDAGDTVSVRMGLRRFKDEWQEDDEIKPEQKRRDLYKDTDFEAMIDVSTAYSRDFPEATHVADR